MASLYSSFLQSPNPSHLANDASINYITTTTVINEPAAILRHLQSQAKQVTKKEEKVLSAIEGPDSLFLETETTLQFNNGGGAYLPSMDENLLDEKLVTFPLLHVVSFDGEQKIKQIRLHWDQGTLLKQVEAIGKTGRNWPIRDGKAQIEAINKSLKSSGQELNGKPLGSRNPNEVVISQHKKSDSVSATRDPHASLNLFAPRDPNEHAPGEYEGPRLAPRASAKPAPRDMGDLFANGEAQAAAEPGSKIRSPSPTKSEGVILKSGAGKHFTGNRLFDENGDNTPRSPERKKTYGQKYDHFAFGDGEDVPENKRPMSGGKNNKGQATFSFEDFSTPPKYKSKARPDDELHWGTTEQPPPSPPKRPIVHAPRKDADPHFQFRDESSPATQDKPKSHQRQKGMGLYQDPLNEDDRTTLPKSSRNNTTSTNNGRRGDDFGEHFSMTDTPSNQDENVAPGGGKGTQRAAMDQHWEFGTPAKEKKIYKTAGDGMGSRKGGRDWGIGDESDPEVQEANRKSSARGRRAQAQAGAEY